MSTTQAIERLGRPIAYYPTLAKALGGVKVAVFTCQFLYWKPRTKDPDGWVYKTAKDIEEETGLSQEEQIGARKKLKRKGLLEEKLKGTPATLYYKFNWEEIDFLIEQMIGFSDPVAEKLANQFRENPESSFRKTGKLDSGKPGNYLRDYFRDYDREYFRRIYTVPTEKKFGWERKDETHRLG